MMQAPGMKERAAQMMSDPNAMAKVREERREGGREGERERTVLSSTRVLSTHLSLLISYNLTTHLKHTDVANDGRHHGW